MTRGRAAAAQRASGNLPARVDGGQVVQQDPRAATVRSLFERMAPEMQRSLPKHMTVDRMIRVALTVVQENEDLLKCDPRSLLGALMTCTQVGLEPGPQGHVYFVPFARKVTFIMGYRGIIELARRSGLLLSISAHTIYGNEVAQNRFSVEYGTVNKLTHKPIVFEDRGAPVGYYATARIANPARRSEAEDVFVVLTRAEVEAFRVRSPTQKADKPSGPWVTDYEAMAWKTCIRRLERWLPQSPELAAALAHEDTVRTTLEGNVTEQAEPDPQEPFDPQAAGQAVGELSAPETPPAATDAGDQGGVESPPPDEGPGGGEAAVELGQAVSDAMEASAVEDPPADWSDAPTPDPSDPDDPWSTVRA